LPQKTKNIVKKRAKAHKKPKNDPPSSAKRAKMKKSAEKAVYFLKRY